MVTSLISRPLKKKKKKSLLFIYCYYFIGKHDPVLVQVHVDENYTTY